MAACARRTTARTRPPPATATSHLHLSSPSFIVHRHRHRCPTFHGRPTVIVTSTFSPQALSAPSRAVSGSGCVRLGSRPSNTPTKGSRASNTTAAGARRPIHAPRPHSRS
eukprot:563544-Prymnesium_polylepis.1